MHGEQQRDQGKRRLGRTLAVDIAIALVLGAVVLAMTHGQAAWGQGMMQGSGPPWGPGSGGPPELSPEGMVLSLSAYLGIGAAALGAMGRRVWPRAALVVTSGAVLGYLAAGNPPGAILWLLAFVVFSGARTLPLPRFLPWGALAVPAVLAGYLDQPYLGLLDATQTARLAGTLAAFAVAATLGALIRTGRESRSRERAAELRRHGYAERLRIAREVHDVVGHSLSVINMQAGVALHVLDKRPEQAAPALEVIRKASKDALDELRGTLAVFRDQGAQEERPPAPTPGLDRLDDLVAAVTGDGRTVRVIRDGDPDAGSAVPAAVDHAAYRIVQEALTNVVRHAGAAEAAVRVAYGSRELAVEVTDDGAARPEHPPADGGGLAGMRERARAVGGSLAAGPRPEGGFRVRAELPLHRD